MSWRHAKGTVCPTCKAKVGIVLVAQTVGDSDRCPRCYNAIPAKLVKALGEPIVAIEAGTYRGLFGTYKVSTGVLAGERVMRIDYGKAEKPEARYSTLSPEDFADFVATNNWVRVSA